MPRRPQPFNVRQYMLECPYEIFRYRDSYLADVALHHHDFYELYLFLSGDVSYIIESRSYRLQPGDLLLISPSELHQPLIRPDHAPYERIVLWVSRPFMRSLSTERTDLETCFRAQLNGRTNLLRPDAASRAALTGLMERLLEETSRSGYGSDITARCCLLELLVLVNRLFADRARRAPAQALPDPMIARVLDYINAHYGEPLSLDALSARFFVGKYHLCHAFKAAVGTSVYRYVMQKRLLIARQMLLDGTSPTEACRPCGFADYSSFFRAFKAQYGISPSAFYALQADASEDEGGRPHPQAPEA